MEPDLEQEHVTTTGSTALVPSKPSPQLDPSSYSSQIFWLILTFGLLYFLMSRLALPRIQSTLAERQARITADLDRAELLNAQAETARASYEALEAQSRDHANRTIAEGKAADKLSAEQQLKGLDATLASEMEGAETKLRDQLARLNDDMETIAKDVTGEIVEKILGRPLSSDQLKHITRAAS